MSFVLYIREGKKKKSTEFNLTKCTQNYVTRDTKQVGKKREKMAGVRCGGVVNKLSS